jgi:hypothetical protein
VPPPQFPGGVKGMLRSNAVGRLGHDEAPLAPGGTHAGDGPTLGLDSGEALLAAAVESVGAADPAVAWEAGTEGGAAVGGATGDVVAALVQAAPTSATTATQTSSDTYRGLGPRPLRDRRAVTLSSISRGPPAFCRTGAGQGIGVMSARL